MEINQTIEITAAARAKKQYPGDEKEFGVARFFFEDGYETALRDMLEGAIKATVFTNTDPKHLYTLSEEWDGLLGQCENAERVKLVIIREREKDEATDGSV